MHKLLKNALTFAGNAVLHPLAQGLRRDPDLWVFGAGNGRFEGNSKYLYLWLNLIGHSPKPVWITGNAHLARRLRGHQLAGLPGADPKPMLERLQKNGEAVLQQ